ncbi:MAG: mercuric transporter MerT family protein [Acidobacteriota bacterium]|nr:mercuric transporter MerT family protein [Acidobacteriota bacterium]
MKKDNIVLGGSIFAAIGASICCVGPVLFALLGLGAFGASSLFLSLRPYLLAVAVLAIAFGFYRAYFRREACAPGEACATKPVSRAGRTFLWVSTVAVLAFAFSPYYAGTLARRMTSGTAAPGTMPYVAASQPAVAQATFKVSGMTCAGCEATIRLALEQTPGVRRAEVSYDRGEAVVEYDQNATTLDKLRDAINRTGYTVESAR